MNWNECSVGGQACSPACLQTRCTQVRTDIQTHDQIFRSAAPVYWSTVTPRVTDCRRNHGNLPRLNPKSSRSLSPNIVPPPVQVFWNLFECTSLGCEFGPPRFGAPDLNHGSARTVDQAFCRSGLTQPPGSAPAHNSDQSLTNAQTHTSSCVKPSDTWDLVWHACMVTRFVFWSLCCVRLS